ncbi:MAG TPA: EamA family transporter [Desulfonatronum sp.]|nr:EamA family transporter [Desulfonatronum sp.]
MLWLFLALGTAFFEALKDVLSKGQLQEGDEYLLAWSYSSMGLPLTGAYLWWEGIPQIGDGFLLALSCGVGLNLVAVPLYMRAIKASDLSLTLPMLTFTPLFMLGTSRLMLGEFPDLWGGLGMILIMAGAYAMYIGREGPGILAPIQALWREPGPRIMLFVALLWSISANLDKIGVVNSSPACWLFCFFTVMSLGLFPVVLLKSHRPLANLRRNFKGLLLVGLTGALALILQMWALTLTLAAYVVSIKRISVVFGVVFGHIVFQEQGLLRRLVCAGLMVFGVALISRP